MKRKYITLAEFNDIECAVEKSKIETQILHKDIKVLDPLSEFEKKNWETREFWNKESITAEMQEIHEIRSYKTKKKEDLKKIAEMKMFEFEKK